MAALIPLIKDLAPLVLPSTIHITRATELQPPPVLLPGHISTIPAVSGVSKKLCSSVTTLPPQTSTPIRHHGEADTIIYVLSNNCTILTSSSSTTSTCTTASSPTSKIKRQILFPGDFLHIPAWTEYQLVNESAPAIFPGYDPNLSPSHPIKAESGGGITLIDTESPTQSQSQAATDLEGSTPIPTAIPAAIPPPPNNNTVLLITSSSKSPSSVDLKGWGMGTL